MPDLPSVGAENVFQPNSPPQFSSITAIKEKQRKSVKNNPTTALVFQK